MLRKLQLQNAVETIEANKTQKNTPSQDQISQQLLAQILPDLIKNPDGLRTLMEIGEKFGGKK